MTEPNIEISSPSKPKDEVWQLTEQWMEKITTAYNNYNRAVRSYHRNMLATSVLFLMTVLLITGVSSYRGVIIDSSFTGVLIALLFGGAILITIGMASDTMTALRNRRSSISDLADIYLISNELFQMVISTEEKNTNSRYEYLVNHIRILEIKHLLRKVRLVVGDISVNPK